MKESAPHGIQAEAVLLTYFCSLSCGFLSLISWKCLIEPATTQTNAVLLAANSLVFAFLAGLISVLLLPLKQSEARRAISVSMGTGIQSGLLAALASAALILLALVLESSDAATHARDLQLRLLTWHSMAVLMLALFSSVVAGLIGGIIGLSIRMPQVPLAFLQVVFPLNRVVASPRLKPSTSWLGRGLVLLCALGILSPLTLLFREPKVDPPPVVIAPIPQPVPVPPPPFHYFKPERFEFAEPAQIVIQTRKNLPSLEASKPILISPDSRLVAFCSADSGHASVSVMELDTLNTVAIFILAALPDHLAWSPDLSQLLYLTTGEPRSLGVLKLASFTTVALPAPPSRNLPDGPCQWWGENEVAFYPKDEAALTLNLDSLSLSPLAESIRFKALTAPTQKKVGSAPRASFPETTAWKMSLEVCLTAVLEPARRKPSDGWMLNGFTALTFRDAAKQVRHVLPSIVVKPNERVLPAPDGSKLIMLHDNMAEVVYFRLRDSKTPIAKARMPRAHDKMPPVKSGQEALDENKFCAFAYAPLFNPLTGKVIGPDRERVRALLRLSKWEDEEALWWPADQYHDIREGDVIADLHTWDNGSMTPAKALSKIEWCSDMTLQADIDRAAISSQAKAPDLDTLITIKTVPDAYAIQFERMERSEPRPKETKPAPDSSPQAGAKTEADVTAFIRQHHAKAAARDLDGLMMDYADEIDQLHGKALSRSQLRENEAADYKKWPRGTEAVESFRQVKPVGDFWSVSYVVRFTEEAQNGEYREGFIDMTLFVANRPEGFKITVQEASVRDVQTGTKTNASTNAKPKGASPVPVTVPKPCWVGTTKLSDAPGNILVTDALHIQNISADLHRTFRLMDANGKVLQSCRAEYHGHASQEGGLISIYIGEQGWGRDGNKELLGVLAPFVERMVGSSVSFQVSGSDLVEPSTGEVLRLQN